jgi:hypothetical protein
MGQGYLAGKMKNFGAKGNAWKAWYPCPELNRDTRIRNPLLYPFELQGLPTAK